MKILNLSTYNDKDGISEYLKNQIIELEKLGHENKIFLNDFTHHDSFDNANSYYKKFIQESEDFDLIHIQHQWGMYSGNYSVLKIYSVLKSITVFRNILKGLYSDGLYNRKVFVTFHSPPVFPLNNPFFNKFFKKYSFADLFTEHGNIKALVHNTDTLKQFIKAGFHPNSIKKIIFPVFENLISSNTINNELKLRIEKKLNINSNSCILSILGFISDVKGYDDVLEVLKELPPNFKFIILGGVTPRKTKFRNNEKYYMDLLKKIKKYSLEDRVLITGLYDDDDLNTYFNLIDIFLLLYSPKFKDSSGSAHLVISSKSPVIAYDIQRFIEMNEYHDTLYLVKGGNTNELKNKIITLNNDFKLRNYHINEANSYILDNSPHKQVEEILNIYNHDFK